MPTKSGSSNIGLEGSEKKTAYKVVIKNSWQPPKKENDTNVYLKDNSEIPLLWTPWGHGIVSCIDRCPHFRGKFLLRWDIAKCPQYRGVHNSGMSFMRGST